MAKKRRLTESDKIEIKDLYKSGAYSFAKLGDVYGVSHMTIKRVVQEGQPKKEPLPKMEFTPVPQFGQLTIKDDPIHFRKDKLIELQLDIQASRDMGSMGALSSLHKLQLEIHDRYTELKILAGNQVEDVDPEELLLMLEQAIISLPVSQRGALESLFIQNNNVVSIGSK